MLYLLKKKQARFDKLLSHRYPGNITHWIQHCCSSSALMALLYPTHNTSQCLCEDNIRTMHT